LTSRNKRDSTSRVSFDEKESLSRSEVSRSSLSSSHQYEGGNSSNGDNEYGHEGGNQGHSVI
jgi:hypothetical protein